MRPCITVAKCPSPCIFCGIFEKLKISASEFHTMGMVRQMQDEFLSTVTEGVVCGVHKVVT